jgi:hypothetical protein
MAQQFPIVKSNLVPSGGLAGKSTRAKKTFQDALPQAGICR